MSWSPHKSSSMGFFNQYFFFSILELFIRIMRSVHCNFFNWRDFIWQFIGLFCYVLFPKLSHIHRLAQRFFLPFPFKISLAFLLMNESLSILRNRTLVLVRLESRILQVYLFYVIVVVLWRVIRKGIPRLLTKFCFVFLIALAFILWSLFLGNKNSRLLQYPVLLFFFI